MAPYQERAGVSYNDFVREGNLDIEAIRANAGIDGAYASTVHAGQLQP